MKRVWFTSLLAAGGLGYAAAWICVHLPGGYDAMLVLVRAALVASLLMIMAAGLWWVLFIRRMRVRTLVVSGPVLVGVLAVPLPYYSQSRSVQQNLKQIGVRYRVEPVGFSLTLQHFASDLLGLDSTELFASEPTWIEIDPATVRQDQLDRIHDNDHLKAVTIFKRLPGNRLQPELTRWLNSLPAETRIDALLEATELADLHELTQLKRPIGSLNLSRHAMSSEAIYKAIRCAPKSLLFYEIDFPKQFNWQTQVSASTDTTATLQVTHCQLTGTQLIALVQMTGCQALTCDWLPIPLTTDECELLSQIPTLTSISLGDMPLTFEQLYPLVASPQLNTFLVSGTNLSAAEQLELRQAFPEGSNRRVRNLDGRTIQAGDVGRRR